MEIQRLYCFHVSTYKFGCQIYSYEAKSETIPTLTVVSGRLVWQVTIVRFASAKPDNHLAANFSNVASKIREIMLFVISALFSVVYDVLVI